MPDQESQEQKLRSEMRKGRTPLIADVRSACKAYIIAMKGWERRNAELREQVGLLSSEFSEKGKALRAGSRNLAEGGLSIVDMYKELPNLVELYDPVGELYDAYQITLQAYNQYMQTWVGRLPESDLSGRALELALTEVDRSLR